MIAHTLVGTMHRPWQRLYDWLRGTEKLACCVCGRNVEAFVPLPDSFLQVLRDAGWPYGFDRLETLNVARYQCPHCGANDRDRLCALYLDEILASWQRAVTIVQFAPAKTLTDYIRRTMAARAGRQLPHRPISMPKASTTAPTSRTCRATLPLPSICSSAPTCWSTWPTTAGQCASCAVSCGRADAACSWCPSCWASRRSTKTRR